MNRLPFQYGNCARQSLPMMKKVKVTAPELPPNPAIPLLLPACARAATVAASRGKCPFAQQTPVVLAHYPSTPEEPL